MAGKWSNHYVEEVDHLHVLPVGDTMPHCPAQSCYCDPSLELIGREDGSIGAVFLHRVQRK